MQLAEIVDVSQRVAATSGRKAKIDLLAGLLKRLTPDEVELAASYLGGQLPQGKIGLGWAAIRDVRASAAAAGEASLALLDVDRAFDAITKASGAGSAAERKRQLGALWARATAEEGDFLARLVLGELRQGALEGVLIEAIARAADLAPALVRRAAMLAGELPKVARAALVEGAAGLERFRLHVLSPVQPMLAESAEDVAAALAELDGAAFEWKLDGARVQVHKLGDEVRVFSRSLNVDFAPRLTS
jgi:DNA ligase-1